MWLTFTTKIDITHKIIPFKTLVDKECTEYHTHKDCKLQVWVEHKIEFLDFKDIKKNVLEVCKILEEPYIGTIESLALAIKGELVNIYDNRLIRVYIQETEQYGVWA